MKYIKTNHSDTEQAEKFYYSFGFLKENTYPKSKPTHRFKPCIYELEGSYLLLFDK